MNDRRGGGGCASEMLSEVVPTLMVNGQPAKFVSTLAAAAAADSSPY